tara:strand:- start:627 stop:1493 length:867 start_codon:yes stop_codon:yes gene_type:complete
MEVSYDSNSNFPTYNNYDIYTVLNDPNVSLIFLFIGIVVIYIILFSFLGKIGTNSNSNGTRSSSLRIFEIIIFIVFIVAILFNLKYMAGNDLSIDTITKNILNRNKTEMDVYVKDSSNKKCDNKNKDQENGEAFHIPNNVYNYEQAKALCKAYDSKLATYDQIEDAYRKGANWCSYGWSEDQLALFPTSKKSYEKLQEIEGHENDCGRPGVNGGFIDNKLVRFGVNCFGPKPILNENDKIYMENLKYQPITKESIYVNKKSEQYKKYLDKIVVAPFNKDTWALSKNVL